MPVKQKSSRRIYWPNQTLLLTFVDEVLKSWLGSTIAIAFAIWTAAICWLLLKIFDALWQWMSTQKCKGWMKKSSSLISGDSNKHSQLSCKQFCAHPGPKLWHQWDAVFINALLVVNGHVWVKEASHSWPDGAFSTLVAFWWYGWQFYYTDQPKHIVFLRIPM